MPTQTGNELTERQTEVLDFIRRYTAEHGYSPSTRDIGDGIGVTSPNGVMCHIRSLIRKGKLERAKVNGRALGRSFQIVGNKPTTADIAEALVEKFGKFPPRVDLSELIEFVLAFK